MKAKVSFAAGTIALAFLTASCSAGMPSTSPETMQTENFAPLVKGHAEGQEVFFIHTEASDPQVVSMLTMMMGRDVVLVPALAQVPEVALAKVYVFTNGVPGGGPFGFQPDVFDAVPGDPGYSPLRAVNLVTWEEDTAPRELRSVAEIEWAESQGEITVTTSGAVVNMPILIWPGGHR